MTEPIRHSGRQLYHLLPSLYRERDHNHGQDLENFLEAFGGLLDLMRNTLEQKLADNFPDRPREGLVCQDWVLPYLADLLNVRLVSPEVEGRRDEVANAVTWRQRKGTPHSIEQVSQSVGRTETEVQEGFKRVAVTARIGMPLLPATSLGAAKEPRKGIPSQMARHPALPAVTPDLRYASRAVVPKKDPTRASRHTFFGEDPDFDEDPVGWLPYNPHGAPCVPGSFHDVSRRTVDLRTPNWRDGHYHHLRLMLFFPPPAGFFPLDRIVFPWGQRNTGHADHFAESIGQGIDEMYNPSWRENFEGKPRQAVIITTPPPAYDTGGLHLISDLNFEKTIMVNAGRLLLKNVAASKVVLNTVGVNLPVLEAVDCLFDTIEAPDGLVRLENCTVMKSIDCKNLQASDSLFSGQVVISDAAAGPIHCFRFSRLPAEISYGGASKPIGSLPKDRVTLYRHTTERPVFFDFSTCAGSSLGPSAANFGNPGYGVLHPATPEAISFGAEDRGEMGAYHSRRYRLRQAAVADKIAGFLPLGMEAVLVPDEQLLVLPPVLSP